MNEQSKQHQGWAHNPGVDCSKHDCTWCSAVNVFWLLSLCHIVQNQTDLIFFYFMENSDYMNRENDKQKQQFYNCLQKHVP